jgi:hypothetical protein
MRRSPLLLLLALVALALPAPASAGGDLCLEDGAGVVYVFTKPKLPKQTLSSAPLSGFAYIGLSVPAPVSGTVTRLNPEGGLILGITRHLNPQIGFAVLEANSIGSINYDNDLNGATETTTTLFVTGCP